MAERRVSFLDVVDKGASKVFFIAISLAILFLSILLINVTFSGWQRLTPQFLDSFPSSDPAKAGLKSALWGSVWVVGVATLIAMPLGVASALYLTEFSENERLKKLVYFNLTNLAGVPSVVFGLVGLSLLVYNLQLGRSVLAGAIVLAFLVLPVVIISASEAIRAVPELHKLGAYSLGATKVQVVRHVILPQALPAILTGGILSISRAIGEAAPLLVISGLLFIRDVPNSIFDPFTVLPLQIFNWIGRPFPEFRELASAGIIVLLGVLILMNLVAIILRAKLQRRVVE